ncbi:hypothetical protein Hanom_Chr03g00231791 [Helianthus anomalus]
MTNMWMWFRQPFNSLSIVVTSCSISPPSLPHPPTLFRINTSLRPSSLFQLIQLIHPFLLSCKNKVVHTLASLAFAHRKAIRF